MERRKIFGLILILLGILFGMRSMELIPEAVEDLIFRWEMILIGLGLYFLSFERAKGTGLIILLVGLFFWSRHLFELPSDLDVIPLILVLLGVLFLMGSRRHRRKGKGPVREEKDIKKGDRLNEFVMFGSTEKILSSEEFHGGEVSVLFGEAHVDLTRCKWGEGPKKLDVFIFFGSAVLHIPPEWEVQQDIPSIFGSFSDKRKEKLDTGQAGEQKVRIKGFCLFGDGKLRN